MQHPQILKTRLNAPSCWTPRELARRTDWRHALSRAQRDELNKAVDRVAGREFQAIGKRDFEIPSLAPLLAGVRRDLLDGAGFALLQGLPVAEHDEDQVSRMLWGIGLYLGIAQPQDAAGALMHHVRDTGVSVAGRDDVRTYETREAQPWHNDGGDVFALLCRQTSTNGGRSFVASAHTAFNALVDRNPELVEALQQPFCFDARGQQLPGAERVQRVPVFTWFRERLYVLHKRHYVDHAQRFPEVPPLTDLQREALDTLDEVCDTPEVGLDFELEPGDLEVGHNFSMLHKRSAFDDGGEGVSQRHMLRLWLGLPDGWPLPPAFERTREFGALASVRAGH